MNPAKRSISPSAEAFFSEESPDVTYEAESASKLNEVIVNPQTTVLAAMLMLMVLVGIAYLFLF